jgi:hypothetical protein
MEMAFKDDKEREKQLLLAITFAVPRMTVAASLSEEELRRYKSSVPLYFEFMETQTVESHIALLKSHRDDPTFGDYIKKLLTPEGIKWLEKNIPRVIKVAKEHEG